MRYSIDDKVSEASALLRTVARNGQNLEQSVGGIVREAESRAYRLALRVLMEDPKASEIREFLQATLDIDCATWGGDAHNAAHQRRLDAMERLAESDEQEANAEWHEPGYDRARGFDD